MMMVDGETVMIVQVLLCEDSQPSFLARQQRRLKATWRTLPGLYPVAVSDSQSEMLTFRGSSSLAKELSVQY